VTVDVFESNRSRLTGIAYGMLGSVMEAQDVVQDAYLRWAEVAHDEVDAPAAYLTTITTRLAIDRLRSAQKRREVYVGPWLPEPVVSSFAPDPAEAVIEAESLSMAILTALERLNPVERAVLLLREIFDLDYSEIADIVDKSPSNCRQIARRARDRAGDIRRTSARTDLDAQIIASYMDAVGRGDVEGLAKVFAQDIVLFSDGGGLARAARHPLHGATRVARHMIGVSPQAPEGTEVRLVRVNGDPSIMAVANGRAIATVTFEIREGLITAIRAVLNPEKLGHLVDT
jgi:RNA polymerase sigma-70 factor (ECF subfamily)